ncbi:pleckstrin (PH) domain-containing protein [Tieghemostelium lacteum]|uniref:Pleckstrin (PH) domain-containing protein n=1 Tax=Tieghemostelium lacteum TaxID=361077 RepID=A0A151ZF24_TIELA|nr:pleckstrin (PH) domain-containing protein [Tieghemostelium lacteum]|eukprot:KYQ92572.1 pleckstrin (PH) domain-containing protein [Tieghemostelium lacteum]
MSNYFFDQNLEPQVKRFLEDVDDLVKNKSASMVEKLIELVDSEEKPNALMMLAYSTQSPQNKDIARELGLIKLFLKNSHPSQLPLSTSIVKNSVMGAMILANTGDANKQCIADEGGIETIFDLIQDILEIIKSPKDGMKMDDIMTTLSQSINLIIILSTLAQLREKLGSVKNFIVLNQLVGFQFPQQLDLQHQVQERALSSLNNICILKENKDNAKKAGCIDNVLKLFTAKKVQVQDGSLRWIYNMTIIDTAREHIRQSKGIEAYVQYIKENPKETQLILFALKGFSNMAVDRQTIEYILTQTAADENFLKPVLDLLNPSSELQILDQVLSLVQNLVSEENLLDQVAKFGILPRIHSAVKGMPLQNTTQQSIMVKSTCIITALITSEDQQQQSVENGILALLVEYLSSGSPDVRKEAAKALANATPYFDDVRAEIGKQGGVKACLDLLLSSDKELVKQAARSLVNLARNTQNEEAIYEAKGLEHSIRLINSPEKDLKMLGTKLLVNLSLNEKARIAFCQKGGLAIVASLLTGNDIELQLQGTKIVTNLAISGRNRKLMNENVPELIPALQKLLSTTVQGQFVNETKAQADVALNNLAFPYENSYDGLDFGLEDHIQLNIQSQYERDDEEDEDEDQDEKEAKRRQEEEELRLLAEKEVEERKRIMEEEMKRIEQRRKQEQEKREQEELAAKQKKEEAEKLRLAQEALEKLRLEEEAKKQQQAEAQRKKENEEKERLEQERINHLTQQQKLKEEQERKEKLEKERLLEEERVKKQKEQEEKERLAKIEQDRIKKEKEEEAERLRVQQEEKERKERQAREEEMRRLEEEQLLKMQQEIKQKELDIQRKKEEEEQRRKKEENDKKLQDQQDKASQESARLAQEASKAQKRTHIVQEIMQVEVNYVKNLNLIVRKFLHPLSSAAASKRPIITQDKINAIFSTVDNINNHNSILCDGLTSRIKRWLADNKSHPLLIGDIFAKINTFMNDYSKYINNYNNSMKTYNEARKTNVPFAQFIKKVENDPELNDKELENLLITPVQQFPRYIMLIQDLIRNTNEDHPDFKQLNESLEKIKHSTSYINEKKREAEDAFAMLSINQSLHGKVPNHFLAPHRKFIKEGGILFGSSSGSFKDKDPVVFLFNDMIMMTIKHPTKIGEYRYRYSLMLVPGTNIEDLASVNNGFMVKTPAQWWSFSCSSPTEKSNWVEAINKTLKNLPKEALKTNSVTNSTSSSKSKLF